MKTGVKNITQQCQLIYIYLCIYIYHIYICTYIPHWHSTYYMLLSKISSLLHTIDINEHLCIYTHTSHMFFSQTLPLPSMKGHWYVHTHLKKYQWMIYCIYIYMIVHHHPISNPTPISISYCWKGFNSANHCICKQKAVQWEKLPTSSAYIPAGEQFL